MAAFGPDVVCIKAPCPGSGGYGVGWGDMQVLIPEMSPTMNPPATPVAVVPMNQSPVLYAEGSVQLPLVSMGAGALLGYFLGKRNGNTSAGAVAGAMVGYFFKPLG